MLYQVATVYAFSLQIMSKRLPDTTQAQSKKMKTKDDIAGFLHKLSPIKQGKKSPYFTCYIQTCEQDDTGTPIIGFSNLKRNILKEFEINHTPVLISNASTEIESSGTKKVMIGNTSSITGTELTFRYNNLCSYQSLDLKDIDSYNVGDTGYSVNGFVLKKNTLSLSNFNLNKQEIYIGSEETKCLLLLYGNLCDTVEIGKSYEFQPVKLRLNDDNRFLSTTPDTEIRPIHEIHCNVASCNKTKENSFDSDISGNIIAVKEVRSFFTCPSCNRPIDDDKSIEETLKCLSCDSMTLKDICTKDGSVTFSIKSDENTVIQLTAHSSQLSKEFDNADIMFTNISEATKTLLRAGKLDISYNKFSHNVRQMSSAV